MNKMNSPFYTGLCLSSGGVKGISILGALTIFEIYNYLKDIKSYVGCSIGSIISLLLASGWKPIELYRRSIKIKLFNGISDISIENLKSKHGLISNDLLRKELETLVLEKRGKLPTLLDFHNEGIYLAFSICDRRTKTGKKLDWKSDPLLLATEAALMSSNMPVIFPPMDFKGMKVVDGALSNPFPVNYLDNGKDKILGISVYGDGADDGLFTTLSEYLMMPIEEIQRKITKQASDKVDILEMRVLDISVMDLQASFEAKDAMFFAGLENAKVMVRVLNKKRHREKKKKKQVIGKSNLSQSDENKKLSSRRRIPNNLIRIPLKAIPEEVIVKCLLSQPMDILLLAAANHRDTLRSAIRKLSPLKLNYLKYFARQVNDDPVKYSRRRANSNQEESNPFVTNNGDRPTNNNNTDGKYGESYKAKIEENHSQKIYDNLPANMQSMAKAVFDNLSPEQAQKTVNGINLVVEGLNRLGINIFSGLLLQGPSIVEDKDSPREVVAGRVEIIQEDDYGRNPDGTKRLFSDNVD